MAATVKKKKPSTVAKKPAATAEDTLPANPPSSEGMTAELEELTSEYTKVVKSAGKKYGKILDVKVLIAIANDT